MKYRVLSLFLLLAIAVMVILYSLRSNLDDIDKFGLEYNDFRTENNIPQLKSDWKTNDDNALFEYYDNMSTNGHIKKLINISKSVGSERDVFKVDSILFYSLYERNDGNKVIYKIRDNELSKIFQSKKNVISAKDANGILDQSNVRFRFNSSWDKE